MAVVIRLSRTGKKGERKFRIVVKEKHSKRDGGFIDMLGWYEKSATGGKKQINMERYSYWLGQGALPSTIVAEIAKT
jgi:small subunit ribosomal protein S16